jgi:hypothetical protein
VKRISFIAFCILFACAPTSVADAERKKNASWLASNGSPEAIGALGRIADDDKDARDALATLAKSTIGKATTDGGGSALDVELAVWGGVERNASWAIAMTKSELANPDRMNDMASAMKHGSPQIAAFVPDLDAALSRGCDEACGASLASIDGSAATTAIEKRLADASTRKATCAGVGSNESSKGARDAFMRMPESSRDAVTCSGAATRIAARDDTALAWLAKTAEPGLLRNVGDEMHCDRLAKLWTTVFTSRDHATFGALSRSLESSLKTCAKDLDEAIAGALQTDVDTQTLVLSSLGATNAKDLPLTCAAAPAASQRVTAVLARANARDFLTRCAK